MSTHCNVVQFLEPDPTTLLVTASDNHTTGVEEDGVLHLLIGQAVYSVVFASQKLSDYYDFSVSDLINTVDPTPIALTWVISASDRNGFIVSFNQSPDTSNYLWNWTVRVPNIVT